MASTIISFDECLEGVYPFFIPNSGAEKFGLKTGPGIVDLVEFKAFQKNEILEEIQALGFMCPFEPCVTHIRACPLSEFIVVCDPTSKFGEMFLLLHSESSIQIFREAQEKERLKLEEKLKLEEEEALMVKEAELALKNAVYIEKPFYAKEYHSSTADDTESEIRKSSNSSRRCLRKVEVKWEHTISPVEFGDRNHDVSGIVEFRSRNVPEFDFTRKAKDVALNAIPPVVSTCMQTNRNRKVNSNVQYEIRTCSEVNMDEVSRAFKQTLPKFEAALQRNDVINIFSEAIEKPEDTTKGLIGIHHESLIQLNDVFSFKDLEFTKGRTLSFIDQHPTGKEYLATSVLTSTNINQRISNMSDALLSSHIVIWDCKNWIRPRLVLKSPKDCNVFKINPTRPNMLIAGCDSGQVAFWDLSEGFARSRSCENSSESSSQITNGSLEYLALNKDFIIDPVIISHVCHRKCITDIKWLPSSHHINNKGHFVSKELTTNESFQFITVAGDDKILFWDIRYEDILLGKIPHIAKIRKKATSTSSAKSTLHRELWRPIYELKVKRPDGSGGISPTKIHISENNGKLNIICCSEEGEIFGLESTLESAEADKTNQNHLSDYTAWIEKDHLRPSLSLDGSIFYKELYLTVSDWQFHIWKSCGTKLFVSPQSSVLLTGGKWSRHFPGVLYISTCDGSIDVWNFADVSCADFPVTKLLTSPKSITAMEIIDDESTSDEALAIGNSDGSLQVYHLPLNFLKKPKKIHSVPESLAIGGGCIDMKVDLPYSEATRKNASNSNDGNEEKKGDDEVKQNVPKLENFLNSFEEFEKSCAKELGIDIVEE